MHTQVDREDLFQEITLQAWKTYASFRGDAQFSTWLYRVALNTAIGFFRKGKKQPIIQAAPIPDTPADPTHHLVEEQVQAMYRAIGDLSAIDKALVMLYLEDYSYQDIATVLGITPNHVAVKMNRVKAKLKEQTQKHYQF